MDLGANNQLIFPDFGPALASGQGLASPTVITSAAGFSFPVYPQSIAAVAIPAYQNFLSGNNGHLPTSIDPTRTLTVQEGVYSAWPAIVELDPRQDSTGTWYMFHGLYTNSDTSIPGLDANDPKQAMVKTADATLTNNVYVYRAAPLLGPYLGSSSAPSIDQIATAQEIFDLIMTDSSVNMVLQLHTRTYTDTLNFYTWLLQTWAPRHTNAEILNVIGRIFFCVDLKNLPPQSTTTNDYNNLNFLGSWQSAVLGILQQTKSQYPTMPISSFPPLAIMVNFYDDTNLSSQTDVNNAYQILVTNQRFANVRYLGLEITDENSQINAQLQSLGQMAKSQLGLQIGKSVLTPDHFQSVIDTNGNAAIRYGNNRASDPSSFVTYNNSNINGIPYKQLWANNQANLVDLNYSLSFELGVEDSDPNSPMNIYDPADNTGTALTQVQPTIVLSDLPLIHTAKLNGEVRAVFPGTYTSPLPAVPPTVPPAGTQPLPGLVPDVTKVNTNSLLSQMNNPSSDMTVVAADRGYWSYDPENSDPAIRAAFSSGVEVVKVDLRASADGVLVVSHDAGLIRETAGTGFVNSTSWSAIKGYALRDRKGNVRTDLHMLQFGDVLNILKAYSGGAGRGPVIIAEIKDQGQAAWNDYLTAVNLVSNLPAAIRPAVLFKMPMANIPSVDAINTELNAHSAYGHLVLVVNPQDATSSNWAPGTLNFQRLFNLSSPANLSFINHFELNMLTTGDGASQYIAGIGPLGLLSSFATHYEAKPYPEGALTATDDLGDNQDPPSCCYMPTLAFDLRGVANFSLYFDHGANKPNVSLITSDNLALTLGYLVSQGKRNLKLQ